MIRKKGFTLIELLAVIVILAIILAIAVPAISGIIKSTTRESFKSDAKMILKQLDYELLQNSGFNTTSVTEENIDDLKLSNDNYEDLSVKIVNNKPYILIVGKNKWNGLKACGTKRNMNVVEANDEGTCIVSDYIASKGVNKPKLTQGMIPVKWVTDHWVTTTEDDDGWYSYTTADKQWANVVTVNAEGEGTGSDDLTRHNRSYYLSNEGTAISMDDINAFFVWIPRYVYKITDGWQKQMTSETGGDIQVQFSMDVDDTRGGTINIVDTCNYEDHTVQTECARDSQQTIESENWSNHPAFKFGDDQLTGIWVAKFEASNDGGSNINIKPNVAPIVSTSVGAMFSATRSMETNTRYGWGTIGTNLDTHLMKNIEWGAVAYLTQSIYGINGNIGINNYYNSGYRTGCGAEAGSSSSDNCGTYDTAGMLASTTGNTYGIYDMSGGTREYVSAYVNNDNANTYGESIVNSSTDTKYKDVYIASTADTEGDSAHAAIDNYALSINHKGDAVYETSYVLGDSNWYDDYASMPSSSTPWFRRGGYSHNDTHAGVFYFYGYYGFGSVSFGFRPVVLVGAGL